MQIIVNKLIQKFYKTIIIGSGAGGATAAYQLSKKFDSICILEEGKKFNQSFFSNRKISSRSQKLWRNGGFTPLIGNPPLPFAEGVALGGTTVSNGGYLEDIDDRAYENLKNIMYLGNNDVKILRSNFSQIKKKFDTQKDKDQNFNGDSHILTKYLEKEKINYRFVDLARKNCRHNNQCISGCPISAKTTDVSLNLIPDSIKKGVDVFQNTKVLSIKKDGKNIVLSTNNKKYLFKCEKLILSAGALQTPFLLKKNGINNQVGKKIKFHLNYKILANFNDKVFAKKGTIFNIDINHFKNERFKFSATNFLEPYIFSTTSFLNNLEINRLNQRLDFLGMYVAQIEVRGYASLKSSIFSEPLIFYKLDDNDYKLIIKSIIEFCKILFGSGATELILPYGNGKILKSEKDLNEFVKSFKTKFMHFNCAHMMNSCPIGFENNILNNDASLIDNDNIFVLDASTLPTSSDSSPQLAIMSLVKFIIENNYPKFN